MTVVSELCKTTNKCEFCQDSESVHHKKIFNQDLADFDKYGYFPKISVTDVSVVSAQYRLRKLVLQIEILSGKLSIAMCKLLFPCVDTYLE